FFVFSFQNRAQSPSKFHQEPVMVTEGEKLSLRSHVSGTPPLTIQWMKDRRELKSSANTRITFVGGTACLQIASVSKTDAGDYLCKASNAIGSDFCKSRVTVKAVPLKFIKKLEDIVLLEAESIGSSAVFDCQIPPSTAVTSWMKDGTNIRQGPKYKFTADGKDRKLNIIDVQLSDAGEYTCVARNAGREITCTAKLIVEGKLINIKIAKKLKSSLLLTRWRLSKTKRM
uniref:Ig-like domain-containing protein n=1 Tax=Monopterus albus TaxID=43700 RepID=A0A3Q3K7M9_MONAL